jgi:hypothetical protein
MNESFKNIKISEKHHTMLKKHCDKNGLIIYKVIHKWIDESCKEKNTSQKDIYGD